MKKVMKFVKGKKEDDNIAKNITIEGKKLSIDRSEDSFKEDDFINRDKSVTKLHKAVWNENSDKLKTIIKTHDIDITDRFDRTPLYLAVIKNNPSIINLLLENNANQNIPDIDGITPFLKSIQLGYKDCAATLLNQGADLKKTDKDLNSCLHYAVLGKHNEVLSFLLEYDIDCNVANINGDYPIHIAIRMQNVQMIDQLLKNKSDTSVLNQSGFSALMLAQQQNNPDVMALIEKYGTQVVLSIPSICDDVSLKSSYENLKPEKYFLSNDTPTDDTIRSAANTALANSENTSPQSGIIPPPCKPLRSLEYLQTGMDARPPVHLLTLGTVRTRHISMTESEQSKNNTPHRYSYQGDFQSPVTSETCKMPGDDSLKGKLLLSKLECDSTIQSDWGSNESLPLDELPFRRDKSTSNSGSIRSKTTDTFLQKQFSILEDYERKVDALRASLTAAPENHKLDDIGNLLEDNNRINAQLERFAGQGDVLVRSTKSKSLPRNCEQYSSCHKGSYSLPRTLEAGKDPFREMRSGAYFRPRSHFFSLKMLKGDKRNTFLDKLKSMFNKKSQIHLQGHESNGTWLYRDKYRVRQDHEFCSSRLDTFSASDSSSSRKSHHSDLLNEMRCGLQQLQEGDISFSNYEQNKVNEKRRSLNMSRDGYMRKPSTSHQTCKDVEEEQTNKKQYEEELQKLRLEKANKEERDELALRFKEDADRWKKQYEDLVVKIEKNSQEEDWRNLIQNEVTSAVNMLKENSQSLISSLEKQNKKLEGEVEKLQQELTSTKQTEQELKKDLNIMKNHLDEIYYQSEKDMKTADDKVHYLRQNNDKLLVELEHLKIKFKDLQKSNEANLKHIKEADEEKSNLSEKYNDLQTNNNSLQSGILDLISEMNELKEIAVAKLKTIRRQIDVDVDVCCYTDIMKSLDTKLTEITEENAIPLCHDLIIGFKKINNLNTEIISNLKENQNLRETLNENMEILNEKDVTIENAMTEILSLKEKLNEANDILDELTNDLKNKEDVTHMQATKICDLKEILEDEIQKCNELSIINKTLKSDLEKHNCLIVTLQQDTLNMKSMLQQEKSLNKKVSNENLELRNTLETLNREKQAIEEQNIDMKSSFLDLEKEKTELEEKCCCITTSNQNLRKVIETNKDKIQHLEKFNQQLQDQLSEQNQTDDRKLQDFQRKIDVLSDENNELKCLIEEEKDNQTMLKKQIHSLELFHDNEIQTKASIIDELKSEMSALQNELIVMKQSEEKLISVEEENKKLYEIIEDLNKDILSLNNKLEDINSLSDPDKYNKAIKKINKENHELNKKISSLQKQLEDRSNLKDTEKIVEIDVASQKVTEKDIYSNRTETSTIRTVNESYRSNTLDHVSSYKESSNESGSFYDHLELRLSCIKSDLKSLDSSTCSTEEIKSTSLPNLDAIKQNRARFLDEYIADEGTGLQLTKKSSSVECLANNGTKLNLSQTTLDSQRSKCDNRLEKQLETVYRLRRDLNDILANLNIIHKSSSECISAECTNKFKLVVESLQRQVNELNIKSAEESQKCHGLQAELKGLKGQMVNKETMADEILKLRKELYKQKVESVQEIEKCRIKKEAEILEIQFKLKQQYQEKRLKLLADLASVQTTLHKKTEEENKIKEKCQSLMKQVTVNQEIRSMKSLQLFAELPMNNVDPVLETGLREIFQPVSRPSFEPECSSANCIRSKLNTVIEQNRLDAENQDSPEENESRDKYLLK